VAYQWYKGGTLPANQVAGATLSILSLTSLVTADGATYYCRAADTIPQYLFSNGAVLSVALPPLGFTTQPLAGTRYYGESYTFTAAATSALGPSVLYQWCKGGTAAANNIAGATLTYYTLNNVGTADAATYYCRVADTIPQYLASNAAALALSASPIVIQTQPVGGNRYVGETHTFSIEVSAGTPSYTYQWFKGGTTTANQLAGQTGSVLNLVNLQTSDAGNYYCRLGDVWHPSQAPYLWSNVAALTVTVSTFGFVPGNPLGNTYTVGQAHTFQAVATGGVGSVTYQWYKDGTLPANAIAGATATVYSITNLQMSDNANYLCMAMDAAHPPLPLPQSQTATLVVNPLALGATALPASGTRYVTQSYAFSVTATGGRGTLTYQWTKDGTGNNIAGANGTALSLTNLTAADSGSYVCMVGDADRPPAPLVASSAATLTVSAPPIGVTLQPVGGSAYVGSGFSMTVTATSGLGGGVTYQWTKNGTGNSIAGATTTVLTFASVVLGDAGTYQVLLGDAAHPPYALALSNAVTLATAPVVSIGGQPAGGNFYVNDTFNTSVTAAGGFGTLAYQWYKGGTLPANLLAGETRSNYTNVSLVTADAGNYYVRVTDAYTASLFSNAAAVTVAAHVSISVQPVGATMVTGQAKTFTVTAAGGKGTLHYQWTKDGANVGADSPSYSLTSLTTADSGSYQVRVTDVPAGTDAILSVSVDLLVTVPFAINPDPVGANLYVGDPYAMGAPVVGKAGTVAYQWYKNGTLPANALVGETLSTLTFASVVTADAATYRAYAVDDRGTPGVPVDDLTDWSAAATLTVSDHVSIATQPVGGTINVNDPFTFSVVAAGGKSALQYQWAQDGAPIAGATLSTYSIVNALLTDAGTYTVTVIDAPGGTDSVTSSGAVLTVNIIFAISPQPVGGDIYEGDPFTFSSGSVGSVGAVTYQWRLDTGSGMADVPGATDVAYSIVSATLGDAGDYELRAVDDRGTPSPADDRTVISNVVTLNVSAHVTITTAPVGAVINAGDNYAFTVGAAGGKGALHYQWTKDGLPVGTDSDTLDITNATPADAGSYQVAVSDAPAGTDSVASIAVTLVVAGTFMIAPQPVGADIYVGDPYTLASAGVGNVGAVTYQWSFDPDGPVGPADIAGATTTVYAIASATTADSGAYTLSATDDMLTPGNSADDRTVVSNGAQVTVAEHMSIAAQPVAVTTACTSGTASFSISVTGGIGTLTYQWQKDGGDVTGATQSVLVLGPPLAVSDEGAYSCNISDTNESISSNTAALSGVIVCNMMPLAGIAGLALLASMLAAAGARRVRK